MTLTPARAIAAAAIITAHPDPMPHWEGIAADLREWANENDQEGEMPSQDEDSGLSGCTIETEAKRSPECVNTRGTSRLTSTDATGGISDMTKDTGLRARPL